jgi:nitrile hydratase accessory protein
MTDEASATERPIEESEARTKLAELIERSGGSPDDRGEGPTFDSPAQARAFGLVVSLWREGVFEWEQFQAQLIERIETDEGELATETERAYYDYWIEAAERLLEAEGHVSEESLEERAREFADGERDASEFVIGEREH